jgi:hypothetical protein
MVVLQRQMDKAVQRSLRRLLRWMGLLLLLLGLVFGHAQWRQQRALSTLFEDRVVPLHQLQRIGQALNVTLAAELDAAVPEPVAVKTLLERQRSLWRDYLQTYLTDEERLLADLAGERLEAALQLAGSDQREAYAKALQRFNASLAPLLDLQVRVAGDELRAVREQSRWALGLGLLALFGCGGLLLLADQLLRDRVVMPVRVVADALAGLSVGSRELGPEAEALDGDFAEVGAQLRQLRDALQAPPPPKA